MPLKYLQGFGNQHKSECLEGALPKDQNNPQRCPYGLYAEQMQGSAFTAPRHTNFKAWYYRIRPSTQHGKFSDLKTESKLQANFGTDQYTTPERFRWLPQDIKKDVDFADGLTTYAGAGSAGAKAGFAVHHYAFSKAMYEGKTRRVYCNADGDFLIVPQQGSLLVKTEYGDLEVEPEEIVVVQRGIRFAINPLDSKKPECRGYICELFQGHFQLPGLGPIGANGLAKPRDFLYPTAKYEDSDEKCQLIHKMQGKYFQAEVFTPFDVVAWHGNYAPFKYDLRKFMAVNTVTYDHIDPSIFTVLTAQSASPGTAVIDFVIFPPRWGVANHTFRPPYYHRNTMSEYMGLIKGQYEAKTTSTKQGGFVPGGSSLHNCMTGHGPETKVFEKESTKKLEPERVADGSMAFMFESMYHFNVTKYAVEEAQKDDLYVECWADLKKHFNPNQK